MTEETLFAEAIEKSTPAERAAFLDAACRGDAALRQRVEALLQSHSREDFLKTPAIQRAAEVAGGSPIAGATQAEVHGDDSESALDFLVPSEKPDSLGRLGHYEVQEIIGRGGMGVVLRAFDEKLHRVVAIKVMAAQLATNATARKRFTREAQAQAAVSHDHIVTIHAVEEANGLPYLVMQYISGMSLQERLDKSGPMQLHEILRIGMQTASALAAAHAQGLVHRDIKPANILLENGVERVKITDFGLARAATEASLTQSGVVAGTPQYMSPEQAEGKAIDQRTDLFSLGSVLYAMCTGRAPFRASGTMAVLKRVCEETPTPIHETNPDIPNWLAAIIEKLHAKDPAQRYQSAAEVAEVLGRHLAQVQHPSVVPLLPSPSGRGARVEGLSPAQPRRRRLAVAAAVFLCFLVGLGLTEATGVTNVRGTVIRIFTPDGMLVVDINDPGVKVTIEGDGGLVITGAGLEEIRLRPGSYKVHADRDGKRVPLDRELVSIAKNGREVVKVKLEAPPVPVVAKTEKGVFLLLAAGKERKFDTLDAAVSAAYDGDTIEVRGNGPFLTPPLQLRKRALTIRASEGFRPVIKLSPEWAEQNVNLLDTQAALVLEGLELHRVRPGGDEKSWHHMVLSEGAPVRAANCRFVLKPTADVVHAIESPILDLRNCEFRIGTGGKNTDVNNSAVNWAAPTGGRCRIQNCLTTGKFGLVLYSESYPPKSASVVLAGNTLVGWEASVLVILDPTRDPPDGAAGGFSIAASTNVLDGGNTILNSYYLLKPGNPPPTEADFLRRSLTWKGDRNQFSPRSAFTSWAYAGASGYGLKDLAEWNRFWRQDDSGCRSGKVRYQGGDLMSRADKVPEQLTPEDFRLRPDSPGYKAGKDGKDLGADVDLVGPGPAYERWKKTPEYQQWLKDTKQVQKAEAPKAEPKAFVLLGGKGVEVRKFDSLAEAVQPASDGDTIEVRGNGPFVTEPVALNTRTLTIRAGGGYRPVIRLSPQAAQGFEPMLWAKGDALAVEGIEFQRLGQKASVAGQGFPRIVYSDRAALSIANCRFRLETEGDCFSVCVHCDASVCVDRNCEFFGPNDWGWYSVGGGSTAKLRALENCVHVGNMALAMPRGTSVRLTRNTLVSPRSVVMSPTKEMEKGAGEPTRVEASGNVFDTSSVLWFSQDLAFGPGDAPQPADAEKLLLRLLAWHDRGNVYREGSASVLWWSTIPEPKEIVLPRAGRSPADWKKFWNTPAAELSEGSIRYRGGDILAKFAATPEKLTPEDFRLRPDSAGYRAGKDGKDLGADVDLVGPGAAYERWKKTPDYQQWLKDSGQVKK